MSHTQGPWTADGDGTITAKNKTMSIGQSYNVAWPCGLVPDDHIANARLMASAPDLLAALEACNDAMEYMSEYDIPVTLPKQVMDAIAKAKGEMK